MSILSIFSIIYHTGNSGYGKTAVPGIPSGNRRRRVLLMGGAWRMTVSVGMVAMTAVRRSREPSGVIRPSRVLHPRRLGATHALLPRPMGSRRMPGATAHDLPGDAAYHPRRRIPATALGPRDIVILLSGHPSPSHAPVGVGGDVARGRRVVS